MPSASPFWVKILISIALGLPILAGFLQSLLASFGIFPALGFHEFTVEIWQETLRVPSIWKSTLLSLWTGGMATLLSLFLACSIASTLPQKAPRLISVILATPHAAIAVGFAFLIAPSGWLVRVLPFGAPPQIVTGHDPLGVALILALTIKETPFLLIAVLGAMSQKRVRDYVQIAQSMGMSRISAWLKIAFPMIYPLTALPIFIVFVFGLSVVDMALIIGPTQPPTLSIAAIRLFHSPNLENLLPASAMAVLIFALAVLGWLAIQVIERSANFARNWLVNGDRNSRLNVFLTLGNWIAIATLYAGLLSLFLLLIWSISWRWSFPEVFPSSLTFEFWANASNWFEPFIHSLFIGLVATLAALGLAILWLESHRSGRFDGVIFVPLILPQISFLFGLNTSFLQFGLNYGIAAVIGAHLLFVFPYLVIILRDPWRNLNPAYLTLAASFGLGAWARLWRVKLPLLFRPIAFASAIGFAVSIAQYLPTLFLGGGRIETLTTEAVTLSSSGDRRVLGVYGSLQMFLPLLAFLCAFFAPKWIYRNRKAMTDFS